MTAPEVKLWSLLRGRRPRFRRQHPVGPYILDFFCPERRLAVEVDGAGHDHPTQAAHDADRGLWLEQRGIRVIRFAAAAVLDDEGVEGVLQAIFTPETP